MTPRGRGAVSAPYFNLARAAWIPCATWWDAATGEFRRRGGSDGFTTWQEAMHAGWFLFRIAAVEWRSGACHGEP
jgi:hypothetical protein